MKHSKKNIYLLFLILCSVIVTFSSCKEDEIGAFTPKDPDLSLNTNEIEVPKTGGLYDITVQSNLPWRVKSNVSWISIENGYGMGDGAFTVKVEKNETLETRSGKLIAWITEDAQQEIIINQEIGELPPEIQTIYYVKTLGSGDNDGLSWEKATTLDNALSLAVSGDIINVAAGTYVPTKVITGGKTTDEKDKTFEIKKNIALIGGYPANATTGAETDFKANPTILSGNVSGGKSYHTLCITAPIEENKKVKILGLTIRDGQADATSSYVTINSIRYQRNYAGGVIIGRAVAEFEDCEISNNSSLAYVAGVYVIESSTATFNKCNIVNNTTTSNGGALWNDKSTVFLYNCNISSNSTSTGVAAGIYAFNASASELTTTYMYNTTINNNTSGAHCAGYYGRAGSVGVMVNCTVYGNSVPAASADGGGINLHGGGKLDIISSTVTGNSARTGGGIRVQANSTLNLINSIVAGNTATTDNDLSNAGTANTSYSIVTNKTYDVNGNEVAAAPAFDVSTMLSPLADNGGHTKTCALAGDNNPAVTYGMTASQLGDKSGTYSPEIPVSVITFDQTGKNRNGTTCIGAVIK